MDKKEFLIKMYQYIQSELIIIEKEFDNLEDAIEHGLTSLCEIFKIYDKIGNLCHHHHSDDHDTYA
jgi:hypothetical protein